MKNISSQIIEINSENDFDSLRNILGKEYLSERDLTLIKNGLSNVASIFIEWPYFDEDYRSIFAQVYSRKSLPPSPYCARLHLFTKIVQYENLTITHEDLSEIYGGFIVLRPTTHRCLGRQIIRPDLLRHTDGYFITDSFTVKLGGHELPVNAFYHRSQTGVADICAHEATKSMINHMSHRYPVLASPSIEQVVNSVDPLNGMGVLHPSKGINLHTIEKMIAATGCYPETHVNSGFYGFDGENNDFLPIILSYIESGIPALAAISIQDSVANHAVVIMGRGPSKSYPVPKKNGNNNEIYAADFLSYLYIQDDNYLPYRTLDRNRFEDIISATCALPPNLCFPSESVLFFSRSMVNDGTLIPTLADLERPLYRHFLVETNALRAFLIQNRGQFPENVFSAIMELALPKHLWLMMIYNESDFRFQRSIAWFLIDPTADQISTTPHCLMFDRYTLNINDRLGSRTIYESPISGFDSYPEFPSDLKYYTSLFSNFSYHENP